MTVFGCYFCCFDVCCETISDSPSFVCEKLVCKKLIQEICIQVAYITIEVCRTRNMSDDGDDDLEVAATIVLSALTARTSNQ